MVEGGLERHALGWGGKGCCFMTLGSSGTNRTQDHTNTAKLTDAVCPTNTLCKHNTACAREGRVFDDLFAKGETVCSPAGVSG